VYVEWYFRSGLDRYVWIYGMLLAWMHPHVETMWDTIEKMSSTHRNLCKVSIAAIASSVLYIWYVFSLCAVAC
jgi:N-acetylneuraminate 9-O-acetyltransferase